MKIGIAIDSWKLRIFERRLTKAGFVYGKHPGVTKDTLLLTVDTDDKDGLFTIVKAANTEAARTGKKS